MPNSQLHVLHFDLSDFSPDVEFRLLNGVTGGIPLSRYVDSPSKMEEHRSRNRALALLPEEQTARVTHFLEDVRLPTSGVSQRQIVFPSLDDHPLPEIAMLFTHIGADDVMRALERIPAYQDRAAHHLSLATYGVDHEEILGAYDDVHLGAADLKPPGVTAQNIVRCHPDVGTVNGAVTKYVLDTYVTSGIAFSQLVQYLQANGPGTDNQWYNKSWAMWSENPDGTGPMVPAKANTDLAYKGGGQPDWPTPPGASAPGLPSYVLTDEHDPPRSGTGSGVMGAAAPVVGEVLRKTKDDSFLNGHLWTKQSGTTERTFTNTPPVQVAPPAPPPEPRPGPVTAMVGAPQASPEAKGFALKSVTSAYGLSLYDDEMKFKPDTRTLSLPVLNWPSRYLGAYVRFRRSDGTEIKRSDIKAVNPKDASTPLVWVDRLPTEIVRSFVEPSDTKNYLTWISSGNAIFGIPTFDALTPKTVLDFLWPDDASRAEILLGGLGCAAGFADWDSDVDIVGVLGTALVNYGVGVIVLLAGVYVINPFIAALEGDAQIAFYIICGFLGVAAAAGSGAAYETNMGKSILAKLSNATASIIFGKIMEPLIKMGAKALAMKMIEASAELAAEITAEEVVENIPFAGWAIKLVAIAFDLAALAATTVQCIMSPATYELDVLRTMDLTVTVRPDPKHGKSGFNPVWPLVSDHYVIRVAYPSSRGQSGGTTYTKSGPMPGAHDQEITVVFEGIPAGGKIDVSANIYSSTDWLCGRWESGWINALPDVNAKLATAGSIKEMLVPLTPTTTYTQKETIAYTADEQHHWKVTAFSIEANLIADLDKGGAPSSAIAAAFRAKGNTLTSGASITVVDRGQRWTLQQGETAYAIGVHQILGAKAFALPVATYRADLDKGGPTPALLEWRFANEKVVLPTGTTVTVVTPGSRWTISVPGYLAIYEIEVRGALSAAVTEVQWEVTVQNTSNAAPPLPAKFPLAPGGSANELGALQNIVHNNTEYALGYAWLAAGQNMPLDDGDQPVNVPMYAMQSISTLAQPQAQIIEPTRGFSLPTLIAYDQYGLTELFPLEAAKASSLVNGPVATDIAQEFTSFGRTLPPSSQVTVLSASSEWQIGPAGDPLYQLRLVTAEDQSKHIAVYSYPVPGLDNFYLDPRDHTTANPVYYVRGVPLHGLKGRSTFDYDKSKAWGRIVNAGSLQALAVHPHGYLVAVDFVNHKLYVLKLPAAATDSAAAPFAMPLAGEGIREGLMRNPQALTISADGRILILEAGNQRVQAFDVNGNPVPSFSVGQPSFSLAKSFAADLDTHQPSTALVQAFQMNTMPALGPKASTTSRETVEVARDLDAGKVDAKLLDELLTVGYATADDAPANFSVMTTTAGKLWLVTNTRSQVRFDVRLLPDKFEIDHVYVFSVPALAVTLRSRGVDWLIDDTTNAARYEVTASPSGADLKVQQLVSYMSLRASDEQYDYLDIATEPKGYIYVLMVSNAGDKPTFKLDIYNPDGSVLLDSPQSGVNAARLTVNQWRSMFTLNYNVVMGPNGRTEPGVSEWQPSTPEPASGGSGDEDTELPYVVAFSGTSCTRDEGEASRSDSDKAIYAAGSGYIPVRIHKELSGSLTAIRPSATVRGVGENDWAQPRDKSEPLLLDGPLKAPRALLEYVRSYSGGDQRSLPDQLTGWPAVALALHGANLAAESGAVQYNLVGHSRGGVECIMAAWFLYAYGAQDIPVNIFAIDPVPGKGAWYGTLTQLPPNVANFVGVYAWDHLDVGFTALVPRPNGQMTGRSNDADLGDSWDTLADKYQLADPLAANTQNLAQPRGYELYACRGRHSTVAGNSTADGLYDPKNISASVEPVPELVYRLARAYLTKWSTTFPAACAVETDALQLRRKIHKDPARFDAMGGGATRTSILPGRPYVRQISSISGRLPWHTYFLDDVVGDPPYKLAFPVTTERKDAGWVKWKFL